MRVRLAWPGAAAALLAAVLSSARFGSLAPFGPAFFFATLHLGGPVSAAVAVSVVATAAALDPGKGAAMLAAVALGWALAGPRGDERFRRQADLLAAASVAAARLAASGFGFGRPPLWWVETAAEAVLALSLVRLWRPLAQPLLGPAGQPGASEGSQTDPPPLERAVGLICGAAFSVCGLERFGVGPFHPAAAAAPYLTLFAATTLGSTAAASLGVASGFLLAAADSRWVLFGLVQAASGLACAAAAGRKRAWAAAALVATTAAAGLSAPSGAWVLWALGHALLGSALFVATPARLLLAVEERLRCGLGRAERWAGAPAPAGGAPAAAVPGRLAVAWLEQRLSESLSGAERIIDALRAAYETAASGPEPLVPDGVAYVEMVQQRACASCPSFSHCWEASANASFHDVLAFLEAAEGPGLARPEMMPASLKQRCIQPVRMSAAVGDAARIMGAVRAAARQSQAEAQRLVTQVQLTQRVLHDVIRIASQRFRSFDEEAAERLARHLARVGMPARQVVVAGAGARREVMVELAGPCRAPEWCARSAVQLAAQVEGVPWEVSRVACRHGAPREPGTACEVHLVRRALWEVSCAFVSRARSGEACSGDSFSRLTLGPALTCVILSDGMGSGPAAARESEAAVRLAEAALTAGAGPAGAIAVANAVLLARTPDERFATLDIAVFNLASGELELAKAGAYPTFLYRAGRVELIEGQALPAGIVAGVEAEVVQRSLLDGDVVLMVTDGAAGLGEAGEACLEQTLLSAGAAPLPADQVAQRLMGCLDAVAGGRWPDDVTLAALSVRQLDVAGVPPYTGDGFRRPARAATATGRQSQRRLAAS